MFGQRMREEMHEYNNSDLELRVLIAIDSTTLGPAVGGIRLLSSYKTFEEAVNDVQRLSRAMTYKSSVTGLDFGGGKTVAWWRNPNPKRRNEVLRFIAECIDRLKGRYYGGEDMGISDSDVAYMSQYTGFMSGLPEDFDSPITGRRGGGDPSSMTALGVFVGIQAALESSPQFQRKSISGRRFSLQGAAGKVSRALIPYLVKEGARLTIADINEEGLYEVATQYASSPLTVIPSDEADSIFDAPCDVFVPCGPGKILNYNTIPRLKEARCKIVAGCANNQLESAAHARELLQRNILYAVDYVINAGGLISVTEELHPDGYSRERAEEKTRAIGPRLKEIFRRSREGRPPLPTSTVADSMAEKRLQEAEAALI